MGHWYKLFTVEKKAHFWIVAETPEEALVKAKRQARQFGLTFLRLEATGEKIDAVRFNPHKKGSD